MALRMRRAQRLFSCGFGARIHLGLRSSCCCGCAVVVLETLVLVVSVVVVVLLVVVIIIGLFAGFCESEAFIVAFKAFFLVARALLLLLLQHIMAATLLC